MKYIIKLWIVLPIVLISLSKTTYAQTQYRFDSLEVKKIEYLLKDRKFLLKDTSDYRIMIKNLKRESFSLRMAVAHTDIALKTKEYENLILFSDYKSLSIYSDKLEKQNKKLRRKVSVGKYAIPISFCLGVIITTLITK